MYKAELVRKVAEDTRLNQRFVNEVVSATLGTITQALKAGQTVVLPGFGTFYTRERKPGQAKNFRTGEVLTVPALRQADFRAGELLRQAVRKGRRGRPSTGEAATTA